jgi:hypothetical protein
MYFNAKCIFVDTVSKDWKMQYSVCVMCSIGVTVGLLQQSQLLLIVASVIKEFFSFLDSTEVLEVMFIDRKNICKEHFALNSSIYDITTKSRLRLHRPVANLTSYQKGICYASIKTFNV